MTNNKRFTTVELPTPNPWGIMTGGEYLSTYQTCHLLNEYSDKINNLEKVNKHLNDVNTKQSQLIQELAQENNQLKHDATILIQANHEYRKQLKGE